jgi:flagellar basal-body rod modification protein FlgD
VEVNKNTPVDRSYGTMDNKSKSSLAVDDFLQIMAAEIQNQSPLGDSSGGSKTDYLTQLAQFTMLDQMTALADRVNQLSMLNQVNLIGKKVTIYNPEENIVGTVERVKFYNSQVYLQVNGKDYEIGYLMEVSDKLNEVETDEL